jgi:hypothetical protein
MAHKVILPPKKNYIPQFLKQRDINSYFLCVGSFFCFIYTAESAIIILQDRKWNLEHRKCGLLSCEMVPLYSIELFISLLVFSIYIFCPHFCNGIVLLNINVFKGP